MHKLLPLTFRKWLRVGLFLEVHLALQVHSERTISTEIASLSVYSKSRSKEIFIDFVGGSTENSLKPRARI